MSFRFATTCSSRRGTPRAVERIEVDLLETTGVEDRGDVLRRRRRAARRRPEPPAADARARDDGPAPRTRAPGDPRRARGGAARARPDDARAGRRRARSARSTTATATIEGVAPGLAHRDVLQARDRARLAAVGRRAASSCGRASVSAAVRKEIVGHVHEHPRRACAGRRRTTQPRRLHARADRAHPHRLLRRSSPASSASSSERDFDFLLYESEEKAAVRRGVRRSCSPTRSPATRRCSSPPPRSRRCGSSPTRSSRVGARTRRRCETLRAGHRRGRSRGAAVGVPRRAVVPGARAHEIGIVGLGKMGGGLARNLLEHGLAGRRLEPHAGGRRGARAPRARAGRASLAELVAALEPPRVVWLMLPAGEPSTRRCSARAGWRRCSSRATSSSTAATALHGRPGRGAAARRGGHLFLDVRRVRRARGRPARRVPDDRRRRARRSSGSCRCGTTSRARAATGYFEGVRRGALREDGPQRHRVRHDAGHRRGLHRPASVATTTSTSPRVAEIYDNGSVIESRLVGWLSDAFERARARTSRA